MDGGRAAAGGADPSPVAAATHPAAPSNTLVDVSSFAHTPCYCEENIYMLCKELIRIGVADPMGTDLYVVFISNEEKKVPLWHQKASNSDDGFICWDYHVICIQVKLNLIIVVFCFSLVCTANIKAVHRVSCSISWYFLMCIWKSRRNNGEVLDLVWDLDSNLPFPSTFIQYVYNAIQPLAFGNSMYRRLFRVVHAPSFLQSFASDRSHMKDPAGNWIQLPPKYNPIMAADGTTNNLNEYITMSVEDVADLESMVKDVYSNKHGVVVNETILPRFFSRLHGSHP